jgi:uncharacterized protein (TIGR02145 family)
MKKFYVFFIFSMLFCFGKLSAQVTIGADVNPQPFSVLELMGQYETGVFGGLRLPQLSTAQRDAITGLSAPEAKGLTIYNTTIDCIEYWNGTAWISLCDGGTGGGPSTDPGTWNDIECGAYIAPGVWKKFMCRNLGADPNAHPFTPSADLNGDYYQWGSFTPCATRDDIIGTWSSTAPVTWYGDNSTAPDEKVKSIYDPCPAGYRVPTHAEWEGVMNTTLNPRTNIPGTWGSVAWTGAMFGDKLFLPTAGRRTNVNGTLDLRGTFGYYWSSRMYDALFAYVAIFNSTGQYSYNENREKGYSIRCIAE